MCSVTEDILIKETDEHLCVAKCKTTQSRHYQCCVLVLMVEQANCILPVVFDLVTGGIALGPQITQNALFIRRLLHWGIKFL